MGHHSAVTQADLDLLAMLTSTPLPDPAAATSAAASHSHESSCNGCSEPHQPSQAPTSKQAKKLMNDRRPVGTQDPLMVAAAAHAGPEVTRNHYFHDFFPQPLSHSLAYASCDGERLPPPRRVLGSRQAPRRERLALEEIQRQEDARAAQAKEMLLPAVLETRGGSQVEVEVPNILPGSDPVPMLSALEARRRRLSLSDPEAAKLLRNSASPAFRSTVPSSSTAVSDPLQLPPHTAAVASASASNASASAESSSPAAGLIVQCQVRTRIPTPHGHIFLYLYKNNHDDKEHLAFVADQAQMDAHPGEVGPASMPFLRSRTLDSQWREGETEMERIVRGAYVGRLSASTATPSLATTAAMTDSPLGATFPASSNGAVQVDPPLVRIHSECFTGETIGSQRCDCGEQLDEAFRLISQAQRGVVVYLRQEGRGIGLLEKMRAYNLQDLGHDTVTANLLLGHGADMRTYDIAGAILRDLGVGEVKLLTNNPDKIEQIEKEGITVVERRAMVPRSWVVPVRRRTGKRARARPNVMSGARLLALAQEEMFASQAPSSGSEGETEYDDDNDDDESDADENDDEEDDNASVASDESHNLRRAGVGMIGASITRSKELDKYLRTKIERMGHMLSPPPTPPSSRADSPAPTPGGSGGTRRVGAAAPVARKRHVKQAAGSSKLSSSIVSLGEGESEACGSGCEECADDDVVIV